MSVILSICSGDTLNDLVFIKDNDIQYETIIFHDILYEKNYKMISEIKSLWKDKDVRFSYNLTSLKHILGYNPKIDYLIGFNIQELYCFPPKTSVQEMNALFNKEYKEKSLYMLCKYIRNSQDIKTFIFYNNDSFETSFQHFYVERKNILRKMKNLH